MLKIRKFTEEKIMTTNTIQNITDKIVDFCQNHLKCTVSKITATAVTLTLVSVATTQAAFAGAIRSGFNSTGFAANDDGSVIPAVALPFTGNFYGLNFNSLFVNNNGNVTLDAPLSTFTPFNLNTTPRQIIAPFFADVDTRGSGSNITRYGTGTVGGRNAFGVTWDGVGYYAYGTNRLNDFQLILTDRSDIAAGDFDIEFNYDQIQWETGSASGGSNGLGGSPARAGFANGTIAPGTFYELLGSGVQGSFLDTNPTTGLIYNSLNSNVDGRYYFRVRNGRVDVNIPEPGTIFGLLTFAAIGVTATAKRRKKI